MGIEFFCECIAWDAISREDCLDLVGDGDDGLDVAKKNIRTDTQTDRRVMWGAPEIQTDRPRNWGH